MNELKIEYLAPEELTPYEHNTRKHAPNDIEQIKQSILENGFDDPIGIWGDKNIIVEGHGRQIAALELHLEKVPVIRLDHLTDTQRRKYAIQHNRTAELSSWDFTALEEEIAALEIEGMDFEGLKFEFASFDDAKIEEEDSTGKYTNNVNIPQYEPTGEKPNIGELVKLDKVNELLAEIESSDLPENEKEFLRVAAYRHAVIDFDKVANYYACSDKEMQQMMENSALVIIDIQDAIAKGYVQLSKQLDRIMQEEEDD